MIDRDDFSGIEDRTDEPPTPAEQAEIDAELARRSLSEWDLRTPR